MCVCVGFKTDFVDSLSLSLSLWLSSSDISRVILTRLGGGGYYAWGRFSFVFFYVFVVFFKGVGRKQTNVNRRTKRVAEKEEQRERERETNGGIRGPEGGGAWGGIGARSSAVSLVGRASPSTNRRRRNRTHTHTHTHRHSLRD